MEAIYIRVLREKRTLFFFVKMNDLVDSIRRRLQIFYKCELGDMRLYMGTRLLDPNSNIYDQDIKSNSQIIL